MNEQKYYLRIPNVEVNDYDTYLNYNKKNKSYFIHDNDEDIFGNVETQFTQEEIEDLPNQDFINTLEMEEV